MERSARFSTIVFAAMLSPAMLQTSDCQRAPTGNTFLSLLELDADGENRVDGFVSSQRDYNVWVPLGMDTVTVRVQSVDPGARITLSYLGVTQEIGIGGGEVDVTVSLGVSAIAVLVYAPQGAVRAYALNVTHDVTPSVCTSNGDCPAGYMCEVVFPVSCVSGVGVCESVPTACPLIIDLVCGCDGVTYLSYCDAKNAGVRLSALGSCECTVDADCDPSEYCNALTCDGPGTCTLMPGSCSAGPGDVVACDGLTYDSVCAAAALGVRVGGEIYPPGPWSEL